MNVLKSPLWSNVERILPWFVLAILLFYSYAKFFGHPYGFRWNASTSEIIHVFDIQPEPTLQTGDRIVQIGEITWTEFAADLNTVFFRGVQPGDTVLITIDRAGKRSEISWTYPGFTREEFLDQLYSEWGMAYIFWLAGLLTILFVRPKDDRWLLMALFNFLTAIWLITGSGVSAFHLWGSALVLRMVIWLCVPVYLHLHWVFPQPLGKIPPRVLIAVYGVTFAVVVAQGFQLIPRGMYQFGFLFALLGSFILLVFHLIRQPLARRDLRFLFVSVLLAIALAVIWDVIFQLNQVPRWLGGAGLLGLPLLPMAYLYSAFRRRLGGSELRVNRFFSVYLFVILLGILELPIIVLLDQLLHISGEVLAVGLIAITLTTLAFIWAYPAVERFIETRVFGIPLPSQQILERYSAHITTSLTMHDLSRVITEEILPSLLTRQFAFFYSDQDRLKLITLVGVSEEQLPNEQDIYAWQPQFGRYRPVAVESTQPYDWIRLILPLKLGTRTIGFWLLGRRDPDDWYPQAEISILQSLANQTAVALSNFQQTEQIREMYEANIQRHEQERQKLARDLHDSVLNELAALATSDDVTNLSPRMQETYDAVTQRLREIVVDLRPPMLNFGLRLAFAGLADHLMDRRQDSVQISAQIQADDDFRYTETVEINLFRIVQEACQNAVRYAHAKSILIEGTLTADSISVAVLDDGIGFVTATSLKLNEMLAKKHFGLANMLERANLIGATIQIESQPGQGTQVRMKWQAK